MKNQQSESVSKSLFNLLNQKVKAINKKSNLRKLEEKELNDIKALDVVLGVYSCRDNDNNEFLVYKIFVVSDVLIKGSYKSYNIISNSLLAKNKDKEVTKKVNIYNHQNEIFINTFIEFIKNKLNDDPKPGEYILQGLKLVDLLEVDLL